MSAVSTPAERSRLCSLDDNENISCYLLVAIYEEHHVPTSSAQMCSQPFRIRDRHRVDLVDILPRHAYARNRRRWLRDVRDYLSRRRIRVGKHASLLFENAVTVRHQVQEVLYWETTNDEAACVRAAEELETYRSLLPAPGGLAATLLVDGGTRDVGLAIGEALASGRSGVGLVVGDAIIPAHLAERDPDPAEPVKFLRFDLTREHRQAVLSGMPVSAWIVANETSWTEPLSAQTVAALVEDIDAVSREV